MVEIIKQLISDHYDDGDDELHTQCATFILEDMLKSFLEYDMQSVSSLKVLIFY